MLAQDDRVPVNASREMFHALLTSRAIPAHRVLRRLIGDPGESNEAIELSVTPSSAEESIIMGSGKSRSY